MQIWRLLYIPKTRHLLGDFKEWECQNPKIVWVTNRYNALTSCVATNNTQKLNIGIDWAFSSVLSAHETTWGYLIYETQVMVVAGTDRYDQMTIAGTLVAKRLLKRIEKH